MVSIHANAKEQYYAHNKNHQGYSITAGHDPNSIIIAGSTCQNPRDCKIFIQGTDRTSGTVQWRKEYNYGTGSERCFKILKVSNGYLLTGYYSINDRKFTYVMNIDNNGSLLWSKKYNDRTSVGLNLHECSDNSGYIVVGYMTTSNNDLIEDPSIDKEGYIMKISKGSAGGAQGNIIWNLTFNTPRETEDYDMAEDIIEVPGNSIQPPQTISSSPSNTALCYYITGSVNLGFDQGNPPAHYYDQKVLSLMVDDNGNPLWQASYTSGMSPNFDVYQEIGVSSLYDPNTNTIYQVSNSESSHGFYISKIDPWNGTIISHRSYRDATLNNSCKLAAYQILLKNTDSLSVVGFIHNYDWATALPYNPIFAIDVELSTLDPDSVNIFEIPSDGHNAYFSGWLGTPIAIGFPTIHTPDMALKSNNNIDLVAYIKGGVVMSSTDYDLAVFNLNHTDYTGSCYPVRNEPAITDGMTEYIFMNFSQHIFFDNINFNESQPAYDQNSCDSDGPVITEIFKPTSIADSKSTKSDIWDIYPNPAKDKLFIKEKALGSISESISIMLVNSIGKTISVLYQGDAESIKNINEFSLPNVPKGIYYLNIASPSRVIHSEQLIIK